jgi:hypothetical protein
MSRNCGVVERVRGIMNEECKMQNAKCKSDYK